MTGRDMRKFLSNHRIGRQEIAREDETDKLVVRMKEGLGSSKYSQVDYEKLKAYTLDKKVSGNRMLLKMQKLSSFSKANRENNLLKQHRAAWLKECTRLETLRKRADSDCEVFIDGGTLENSSITMFMFDVEDYLEVLEKELKEFKSATLEPVWNLRDDLQAWMSQNEIDLKNPSQNLVAQHKNICSVINSVKLQEKDILDKLMYEQLCIEAELKRSDLQDVTAPSTKMVVEGIPVEAEFLECPDDTLRSQVLEQFLVLDEYYKQKLKDLDSTHIHVIKSPMDGWEEDDHFVFQATVDRYPPNSPNRRVLYLDMLKRFLPHKTRAELVAHEEWIIGYRFYNETRKVLVKCWARDKQELFNRAASTFADACLAKELEHIKAIDRQNQKQICQQLGHKLQIWHEQKQEALKLEAEIFARQQEKLHKKQMKELEKEQQRRATQKQQIDEFHEKLAKAQEKQREEDEKRLASLREQMAEQAVHDQQRVEFRENLMRDREKMKEEERKLQIEEELKREQRLDALRQQVKVDVDYDPVRMMQDTVSSNAKKGIGVEEDINIQRPLFDLVSFTSETVQADPRLRMEEALRKAGLHENPYARKMLATIKPVKPPRRDMQSDGMKNVMNTEL
ncbi:coiled-coil domain-containing protein 148-like [Anneissia japonica]|uniref:coiled-coil domain-containing protein 148-like n=1 Tax=Anneissia japonica TaxID=1529436 RepID=UPI001425735C|nr:coiled-coil domain-containing protein 148-like [Anneissia japonica]XP_033126937.1 coiled-coil domain-containing protein 148-like [Anneissia japonica]